MISNVNWKMTRVVFKEKVTFKHQAAHVSHNYPSKTPILELRHFSRVGMNAFVLFSPKVNSSCDIHVKTGSGFLKLSSGRLCDFQCQIRI